MCAALLSVSVLACFCMISFSQNLAFLFFFTNNKWKYKSCDKKRVIHNSLEGYMHVFTESMFLFTDFIIHNHLSNLSLANYVCVYAHERVHTSAVTCAWGS
jgi:hypothetical protein